VPFVSLTVLAHGSWEFLLLPPGRLTHQFYGKDTQEKGRQKIGKNGFEAGSS
jgi:hypothetical protein